MPNLKRLRHKVKETEVFNKTMTTSKTRAFSVRPSQIRGTSKFYRINKPAKANKTWKRRHKSQNKLYDKMLTFLLILTHYISIRNV